eukprot:3277446-Pleurochrysis_carterae.AAC.6
MQIAAAVAPSAKAGDARRACCRRAPSPAARTAFLRSWTPRARARSACSWATRANRRRASSRTSGTAHSQAPASQG